MLNCAECGKEIVDETSSFCAYCGNPFDSKKNKSELISSAAILLIIAATFTAAMGIIGLINYLATLDYVSQVGGDISVYLGFLIFGIFNVIACIPGLIGGLCTLFKKRYKFSLISAIVVLASALVTFMIIEYYAYGYADSVLILEISILVFSFLSIFLINKSKMEFNEL